MGSHGNKTCANLVSLNYYKINIHMYATVNTNGVKTNILIVSIYQSKKGGS
jgi:hypothetical protein